MMPQLTSAQIIGIRNAAYIFDAADRTYGRCHRHKNSLLNLVLMFSDFHTFDRRDQVFALIPLWQLHTKTAVLPPILDPDYTLSVSGVSSHASRFVVQETRSLLLVWNVCGSSQGKDTALWPSWVPVLDLKLGSEPFWSGLVMGYKADDLSPLRVPSFDDGSDTLDVDGLIVDEVIDVTRSPMEFTASSTTAFVASAECLRPYSTWVEDLGGDLEQRASLVLIAGRTIYYDRVTDEEALQGYQSFKAYVRHRSSFPPPMSQLEASASNSERAAVRYAEWLRHMNSGRAVFHTKDGHLGLGPARTQPGDILAILYGCQYPVVMRPLPTPGEYTFLECAYVYGIMDGEAVRRHKELGREDDIFRII
jgi:hypothetical protein